MNTSLAQSRCRRPAMPRDRARAAFSLTELLVAMTIALVVMAAVASLFGIFGRGLSQSQATVELSAKMRSTAWRLRQDLAGVTVRLRPWVAPESNSGYFELLEGLRHDSTAAGHDSPNLEGDTDDILLFTTRSAVGPFVGRRGAQANQTVESDCAEVAWFCREAATQPLADTKLYNLYRRQLLVMGYMGPGTFASGTSIARSALVGTVSTPLFDVSLRLVDVITSSVINAYTAPTAAFPNTLGDLTKRENRLLLSGSNVLRSGTFPYAFLTDANSRAVAGATFDGTERVLEDVILTNVIAFDVRVFDPESKAQAGTNTTLYPGDPGYAAAAAVGARGAYVDLGRAGGTPTAIVSGTAWPPAGQTALLSMGMQVRNAATSNTLPVATYDTWSLHYESNGVDDDGDGVTDEGTNGLDENGNGVPDDPAEYETSPPYPVPLRGIEVRIRCYEPSSRQVRQITVRHSFERK